MPLQSYTEEDKERVIKEIQKEVQEVLIETDKEGIIIKADTILLSGTVTLPAVFSGFAFRRQTELPVQAEVITVQIRTGTE